MTSGGEQISCIIPAYNEAARIQSVLKAVVNHPLIDEVIVVDDGSQDATRDILKNQTGITAVLLDKNQGKSNAIVQGLLRAKHELILMIDADLIGLEPDDLTALITPVTSGRVDITISLRSNSVPIYRWLGLDFVSGERVFHKSLFPDLRSIAKLKGYQLEVAMNDLIIKQHMRIGIVRWHTVIGPLKSTKIGFFRGWWKDAHMVMEIIRYRGLLGVIKQYMTMHSRIIQAPAAGGRTEGQPQSR
jgi:glycosyltransferase involved in cell wall biosynthesis